MDIIYLLVCIAVMLLVISLAYAVWSNMVNRASYYLESIIGTKKMDIISLILSVVIMILVVWKLITS